MFTLFFLQILRSPSTQEKSNDWCLQTLLSLTSFAFAQRTYSLPQSATSMPLSTTCLTAKKTTWHQRRQGTPTQGFLINESPPAKVNFFFFLYAPGVTWKTYLFNTLLALVRDTSIDSMAVAFFGIAAMFLQHGQTAHSVFKIPLHLTEKMPTGPFWCSITHLCICKLLKCEEKKFSLFIFD